MMKCAMPGTQQVRKCSHNIIPPVHTLHFVEITVSHTPTTPWKSAFGMKCVFFSLSTMFVPDILNVFTHFHRNILIYM